MVVVHPAALLRRLAFLSEALDARSRRSEAFRRAAAVLDLVEEQRALELARTDRLRELPGIGDSIAAIVGELAAGRHPARLADLEARVEAAVSAASDDARQLRRLLRGDCHTHSAWSDGLSPIEEMALAARELGHEYIVLTDHSPRLQVARGLSAARLEEQLDEVASINARVAPFRILTGIETDILTDGRLDQRPELLARLDIVVGSVHTKLRMTADDMTVRLIKAIANPHMDILGHCTGRMRKRDGERPQSDFHHATIIEACVLTGTAIEINARPERNDPPHALLHGAVEAGCVFAIDSDAHAPGELAWQLRGCMRAAANGIAAESVVNTWPVERLLAWASSHDDLA